MRLGNSTPLLEGETIMSWVSRLARDEADADPFRFLNLLEINRKDILETTETGLERLERLTGLPRPVIERGAYLKISERFYQYRGQQFHAEFAGRERISFCPACLLDDASPESHSRGRRVGRMNWVFAPVRTCPIHRIPLTLRMAGTYAERFMDMALVAPDDESLRELMSAATERDVSDLQSYVENRLDGRQGPSWLDGQQIDLATRATEMLGACLLFGSHVDLPGLTEDQWDAAGAVGFAYTSRGEAGIHDALDEMVRRFSTENIKGGQQAIFGRLYQWLQFNKSAKPRGPIRDVVRGYILHNMAVEPGTRLFGEKVTIRHRHSVASLSKQAGVHPKTLNRALVLTGLMPDGDPDRVNGLLSVEATLGEELAERVRRSVSVKQMPKWLNCNRLQAEMLIRHSLVYRIGSSDSHEGRGRGSRGLSGPAPRKRNSGQLSKSGNEIRCRCLPHSASTCHRNRQGDPRRRPCPSRTPPGRASVRFCFRRSR